MFPDSPRSPGLGTGPEASTVQVGELAPADPSLRLTSQAERQVMHPQSGAEHHDLHDPDWRYYHGAIGG